MAERRRRIIPVVEPTDSEADKTRTVEYCERLDDWRSLPALSKNVVHARKLVRRRDGLNTADCVGGRIQSSRQGGVIG